MIMPVCFFGKVLMKDKSFNLPRLNAVIYTHHDGRDWNVWTSPFLKRKGAQKWDSRKTRVVKASLNGAGDNQRKKNILSVIIKLAKTSEKEWSRVWKYLSRHTQNSFSILINPSLKVILCLSHELQIHLIIHSSRVLWFSFVVTSFETFCNKSYQPGETFFLKGSTYWIKEESQQALKTSLPC